MSKGEKAVRKIIANVDLTLNGVMEAPHTWPSFKTEDVDEFIQASMSSGDGIFAVMLQADFPA